VNVEALGDAKEKDVSARVREGDKESEALA
jgi:hypothetical protein